MNFLHPLRLQDVIRAVERRAEGSIPYPLCDSSQLLGHDVYPSFIAPPAGPRVSGMFLAVTLIGF